MSDFERARGALKKQDTDDGLVVFVKLSNFGQI